MAGTTSPSGCACKGVADAARVDPALAPARSARRSARKLGLAGPVLLGDFARRLLCRPRAQAAPTARGALDAALATYRAHPQVEAVFTAEQLARTPMPPRAPTSWTLIERARASFDPAALGRPLCVLKRHITPIADTATLCRHPRQPVGL